MRYHFIFIQAWKAVNTLRHNGNMEVDENEMLCVFSTLRNFLSSMKNPDENVTASLQYLSDVRKHVFI